MELTVQNVYGLLLRSRLLSVEDARVMFARWQAEAGGRANDPAGFASWMVANRYVTEYQASLLARGHAEGFFLNDYQILDRLGKGRMAGVYRAKHRLGQTVAIKVLPPSKAKDPTLLARFQRESKLATKLRHPNVVRGFQMGAQGDLHYLVMEFLEGATLEEVLASRGRLAAREAVRLAHQALLGLQHLHEQGLVHRDLKPANLMLVPPPGAGDTLGCTLKILDIGLGRAMFDETADEADPGLTTEGVLLGTPDYMSPEQARDPRVADIRSDIYSLGCVLYHLLTGQPPFPDTNIISQMIRHATEPPRPVREFDRSIPDGLDQILGWMMAKDPAGRYPTPERAAKALEVFLAAGGQPPSSPDADPGMRPYLTWLEMEDQKEEPAEAGLPTTVLTAVAPPPVPKGQGGRPAVKPPARPTAPRPQRKAKKKPPGPHVSPKEEPPPTPEVELIAVPPLARRAPRGGGGLTRRELIAFFLGVGSGLAAYAAGRALAALASQPRPSERG
jgi:serine/threonine protein kinase